MNRNLFFLLFLITGRFDLALAINPPVGVVTRSGDQSVVVHWDRSSDSTLAGYRVYRSLTNGPFILLTPSLLTSPGFCDLDAKVVNGQTNSYYVTAVAGSTQESSPSSTVSVAPHAFTNDDDFLEYLQQTSFDYFWYLANPNNGMVPDRSAAGSAASIAAVGFGLTAIGIGIDHGWITRSQGAARVSATLNTFLQQPQGTNATGVIGYKGWFYHFLDMNTALRTGAELSSIDTALLLAGILYSKQYFDGTNANESNIRATADAIFNRVDWNWMGRGSNVISMGWFPPGSFIENNWVGYNEGMLLYCLGMGAATNPLPDSSWSAWTSGYTWATNYGFAFVPFPPLFGHQYSHCWIDFRHIADSYMNSHSSTYFENSRRASLAQRAYCIANPAARIGYSSNVWGLTACDGPSNYAARGAPPALNDDGTIAPTAAGGSIPFTPEFSVPTLRYFYSHFRPRIWSAYGFRDAFNLGQQWYGPDELGIDQGPIVIMIENFRTQKVWRLFMQNEEVKRGLQRAGFVDLAFLPLNLQGTPSQNELTLSWGASAARSYQVEYSQDLVSWLSAGPGQILATNSGTLTWVDKGPPDTFSNPAISPQRFYRVFQFGFP